MRWTLPKKWNVVSVEFFPEKYSKEKKDYGNRLFAVFTIEFYGKKNWWSLKETVTTKRIAAESNIARKTIETYDNFFWFPEMEPFSLATYSGSDFGMFSIKCSYTYASELLRDMLNKAQKTQLKESDNWKNIIAIYEANGEIPPQFPKYTETKSPYR